MYGRDSYQSDVRNSTSERNPSFGTGDGTEVRKVLYLMGILDDQDVEWLGKNGVMRNVPSGTILIHEGVSVSPIDDVYVVLDGRLSVLVQGIGNREIAVLYAGEIVGEMSFVD